MKWSSIFILVVAAMMLFAPPAIAQPIDYGDNEATDAAVINTDSEYTVSGDLLIELNSATDLSELKLLYRPLAARPHKLNLVAPTDKHLA